MLDSIYSYSSMFIFIVIPAVIRLVLEGLKRFNNDVLCERVYFESIA